MNKSFSLFAVTAALVASGSFATASPTVSTASEAALHIDSARVVPAPGGGSYVTGLVETSAGYPAPRAVHLHVFAYNTKGKFLGEEIDKVTSPRLVRSYLNPRPRVSYVVFLPWERSELGKVRIVEHSGHMHS